MKLLLFFFIILVGTFAIIPAYAAIFFPINDYRLEGPPTYCIVRPVAEIADGGGTHLLKLQQVAKQAVNDWNTKLYNTADINSLNTDVWEIKSKIIDSNDVDHSCTNKIFFIKKHGSPRNDVTGLLTVGYFSHGDGHLRVYTENWSYDYVKAVLWHEIGHSFGLGHYESDNEDENKKWRTQDKTVPSIMIPMTHAKTEFASITHIDVVAVFQIYGTEKGFYAFSSLTPPSSQPPPTSEIVPEPIPLPEKPKPIILPFESIEISEQEISISKYEPKIIKIQGKIKEAEFYKGTFVILTIYYPNDNFIMHKIKAGNNGYFELPLMLDVENYPDGTYEIRSSYRENSDSNMFFQFSINTPIAFTKERETSETPTSVSETFDRMNSVFEDRMLWLEKNNLLLDEIKEYDNSGLHTALSYKENSTLLLEKFLVFQNVAKLKIENNDETITPTLEEMKELLSEAEGELVDYTKILTDKKEILNENLVPDWIKNNAGWWAEGQIDDSAFVQGIEFMIKENIISLPDMPKSSYMTEQTTYAIPDWIKNNAGWWAEGQIDDSAFVQGIEFLVKSGIIKVS